jgi:hypothetical protein
MGVKTTISKILDFVFGYFSTIEALRKFRSFGWRGFPSTYALPLDNKMLVLNILGSIEFFVASFNFFIFFIFLFFLGGGGCKNKLKTFRKSRLDMERTISKILDTFVVVIWLFFHNQALQKFRCLDGWVWHRHMPPFYTTRSSYLASKGPSNASRPSMWEEQACGRGLNFCAMESSCFSNCELEHLYFRGCDVKYQM